MAEQQNLAPVPTASPSVPPVAPPQPAAESASVLRRLLDAIFARWVPDQQEGGFDWQQDSQRAYFDQRPLRAKAVLYLVVLTVLVLLLWAAFAKIDEVTRGEGKVIPSRQVQVIQSQDGGLVTDILVREGSIVEPGQLLIKLDPTRFVSTLRESMADYQSLQAKTERLQAVIDKQSYTPTASLVKAIPKIVAQELALFDSSQAQLAKATAIVEQQLIQREQELREVKAKTLQLSRSLKLVRRELTVTKPMVASGAVSAVELLRLEREVNQFGGEYQQSVAQTARIESSIIEAQNRVAEVELEFINAVREELTETLTRANALRESSAGLSDRVKQTGLRSPVRGTIKQLFYNTIGGVVLPGKEVIEIIPLDDTLLLEARITPKDIAFLRPGQTALVKFTAYDFVVYGGLEGTVEHIGVDTVMDEEGNPFYMIKVRTHESKLGKDMPILPGMTVEVDILTGKKTVLAYLLKPVLRAKQYALTER